MYYVNAKFWRVTNLGTAYESRHPGETQWSGPFETRASAETFSHGLATQPSIATVEIEEVSAPEEL